MPMRFRKRPAVEPNDVDAGTFRQTASRMFASPWSALTTKKRSERGISSTPVIDDAVTRARARELRERQRAELQEQKEADDRRQQITDALKRRVQLMGTWFPGDPL